jgi:hypothetical protein
MYNRGTVVRLEVWEIEFVQQGDCGSIGGVGNRICTAVGLWFDWRCGKQNLYSSGTVVRLEVWETEFVQQGDCGSIGGVGNRIFLPHIFQTALGPTDPPIR